MYEDLASEETEAPEPEVPEIEVFERSLSHKEVYQGEFLGCYRELREDWFQPIDRHGVSLGTNLERKVFWSLRNHWKRTSVEQRQRRF